MRLCVCGVCVFSLSGPSAGQVLRPRARTSRGLGSGKQRVSDKRRHEHKVHNISGIYRDTAVLQVSSFVKKEEERKQQKKPTNKKNQPKPT